MSKPNAEVTRSHRLEAYRVARGLDGAPSDTPAERWVETGVGQYREWERIAQAIADAEARGDAKRAEAWEAIERRLIDKPWAHRQLAIEWLDEWCVSLCDESGVDFEVRREDRSEALEAAAAFCRKGSTP